MPKRQREEAQELERSIKRSRSERNDLISRLPHELLLRILSFVPVPTLTTCQRVSRSFHRIAGDSQLWKAAYYNRFVRPRASRLPGIKDVDARANHLYYSSKLSKWLDDASLVVRGKETNWKRQYRLRDNWARGSCAVSEISVAEAPPEPPLLVRFHEGLVYTADSESGLRAWSVKGERKLVAGIDFESNGDSPALPTSLAVDAPRPKDLPQRLAVGFSDGSFDIFELDPSGTRFKRIYSHAASSNGTLSAIAYASPYLFTMTESQLLSLYRFAPERTSRTNPRVLDPPRLVYSLKSHTVWPPLSLSIRPSPSGVHAAIAYSFPSYVEGGWSVGIQELRLTEDGDLLESRLASAANNTYQFLVQRTPPSSSGRPMSTIAPAAPPIYSKPTSLSYSHPYLLASHADNTLTLYLVTSTSSSLSIGPGSRLWGHTSSVSGAHVGGKGKAVSVSRKGDELRIWELEGGMASQSNRRRLANGELSVRIRPEAKVSDSPGLELISEAISQRGSGLGLALAHMPEDPAVAQGWVGFDEESVIVLREGNRGSQKLLVYDFT